MATAGWALARATRRRQTGPARWVMRRATVARPVNQSGSGGVVGGWVEEGREGPAAALLKGGQAGVGGDAVEPGAQGGAALVAGEGTPGAQVRLLHEVFGLVEGPEHAVAVRQQLAPERF